MKCKECGHEIEEEYWEMWTSEGDYWENIYSKPTGKLKETDYVFSNKWEYFAEEDYDGKFWFWRKKKR